VVAARPRLPLPRPLGDNLNVRFIAALLGAVAVGREEGARQRRIDSLR